MSEKSRCSWAGADSLMVRYHDEEWGVPCHDDQELFERLLLECFQAGLSWKTILHKRENFRRAFDGFDPSIVARYDEAEFQRLKQDAGIVRNSRKIWAAINNAQQFMAIQDEFGSFDNYIWQFTNNQTLRRNHEAEVPSSTPESDAMSKDLKKRGFQFVGTTICYAFMQSIGMVEDHEKQCFKYNLERAGS